ncbi:MAG: hypothetical protein IT492_06710 [Gammaproteobacteria bacterium]|nr:hypothetical protein [Gammaproteobacteria bacterium]
MGNVSVVDELLGLDAQPAARGVADFAATIAASNGMLIPLELLVQARLPAGATHEQAALLKREYRHKSRLLDSDRPLLACVCDILADSTPEPIALAACVAALAPPEVPRVLAMSLDLARALTAPIEADEIIIRAALNSDPRHAAAGLQTLRSALAARSDTRLLVVLHDVRNGVASPTAPHDLMRALADLADMVCALPLLTRARGTAAAAQRALYMDTATRLDALGLKRLAPGLYGQRHARVPARPSAWLTRIMNRLPQADVLGLGPAAHSRFNEMHFDNHTDAGLHARDVKRGGYGIARTYASSPLEQFVEALLHKLAGGGVVDVTALAVRCQCASPMFMKACDSTIDALRNSGALSGKDARRVSLQASNDAHFGETHARLGQLRDALPTIAPLGKW